MPDNLHPHDVSAASAQSGRAIRGRAIRGLFHPRSIVTGVRDGVAIGKLKRWVVRRLYEHLARRYRLPSWTTMNYGYAPLPGEARGPIPRDTGEANGLQLYAHVASLSRHGANWRGLEAVEVGSGRGGGAAFVARTFEPRSLLGVDVATEAAALAADRYAGIPGLSFIQGDAEYLDLPSSSADVVLNIESAHCYASVPRFLAEVARVLRPGGELLFAGFAARRGGALDRLEAAFRASPLVLERLHDITPNILAALAEDEARKGAMIAREMRGVLRSFAVGAYAMEGTAMRRGLQLGETAYITAVLTRRPSSQAAS